MDDWGHGECVRTVAARRGGSPRERGRLGIDTEFMSEGRYRALLCLVQIAVDDPDAEDGTQIILLDSLDAVDATPLAELLRRSGDRDRPARRPPGRGDPAPGLEHRDQQHLRHPDRRRLRRGQRTGRLWEPARRDPRTPGRQDRELHALGRTPADRRAAQLRRRGCRAPARAHRRAPAPPARDGQARVGARGVPAARVRHRRARSGDRMGAAAPDRPARPARPGGRARARRLARADRLRARTGLSARCSRTRRWSSSPSASRPACAASSRSGASILPASAGAASRSSRRSPPGRQAPAIPRDQARGRSDPGDAPLIALAEALLRARALEAGLAYELIASRNELEQIVGAARRGEREPDVRTLTGWRRELVGADLRDLLAGRRAIAVGPDRRLSLGPPSG